MTSSEQGGRGRGRGGRGRGSYKQTTIPDFKLSSKPGFNQGSSSRNPFTSKSPGSQSGTFANVLGTPVPPPFKKPVQDFVIYLKDSDKQFFTNPIHLAKQYFEFDQEFPIVNRKKREYYEAILLETNSVKITHVNKNPGTCGKPEIQFSKCFIVEPLSLKNWGVNPNSVNFLPQYKEEYTYWDYIDAWTKAFLYQNSYNTHTWWFRFDSLKEPSVVLKDLPHWFYNWFIKFGPEEDFFHEKIQPIYKEFRAVHPKHLDDPAPIKNAILMRFLGHYSIPWIFQWSYTVGSHNNLSILARDLFYKWWPKYEFDELIPQMHLDINAYKEYNLYVKEEEEARKAETFMNQEFKIPSAAALKKKYVDASPAEIKEKMLKAFIAHLGFLDDDSMSISSKATSRAPSINLEVENEQDEEKEESEDFNENEDMEKYMGMSWADQVEAAIALSKVKKEKAEDSKGKGTKGVGPSG
ncbi:hypothetical protein LguiA_029906 [Lonicera macranthoides]